MAASYVVAESHWRSASKGISYRLFATLVTATVSFVLTGSFKTAAIIGAVEVSAKVLLYWAHERLWARITWGRHHQLISTASVNVNPDAILAAAKAADEGEASESDPLLASSDRNDQSHTLDVGQGAEVA